jgi:hypothetical protein
MVQRLGTELHGYCVWDVACEYLELHRTDAMLRSDKSPQAAAQL